MIHARNRRTMARARPRTARATALAPPLLLFPVVAELEAETPDQLTKLDTEVRLPLDADAHLAVAALGTAPMPPGLRNVGSTTPAP